MLPLKHSKKILLLAIILLSTVTLGFFADFVWESYRHEQAVINKGKNKVFLNAVKDYISDIYTKQQMNEINLDAHATYDTSFNIENTAVYITITKAAKYKYQKQYSEQGFLRYFFMQDTKRRNISISLEHGYWLNISISYA